MKNSIYLFALIAMAFGFQSCQKDNSSFSPASKASDNSSGTGGSGGGMTGRGGGGGGGFSGFSLGEAANYAVVALPGTYLNLSNCTINGGLTGVADGGSISLAAPSTINGDLYLAPGVSFSNQPGRLNGNLFTDQDMSTVVADALQTSSDAAALPPNFTYSTIKNNTTIQGNGTVTVVNTTSVNLNSTNLVFNGGSDDYFVLNVTGGFTLGGSSEIKVSGGASSAHVLINIIGTGSTATTKIGNRIYGSVLAPQRSISFHGVTGQVIAGGSTLTLMSGAILNYAGFIQAPVTVTGN